MSSRYQLVAELWRTGPVYGCLYPVTIPRLKSCCQQRLWDVNGLLLTTPKGEGERQSRRSFIHSIGAWLPAVMKMEGR